MAEGTGNYNTRAEWRDGRLTFLNGGGDAALSDVGALQFGATTTAALLFGGGTSTTKLTSASADKNFIGFWLSSSSATGTTRGQYLRLYLTGGANGEALRVYTTNSAAGAGGGGIHGAHISLSHSGSGNITGLAAATRSTYHVPDANLTGTNSAVLAEAFADGASSAVTGNFAFFRASFGGEATGLAAVEDSAALIAIDGGSIAGNNIMQAKSSAAVTHVIRITFNNVPYYLMVSNAI